MTGIMTSAVYRESAAHAVSENDELLALRELARRVGSDLLLSQGSSGNCSLKTNGVLWIKASGKWMSDAMSSDFLLPLSLRAVNQAIFRGLEPADKFPGASLETALHATMPHRVVLHVHSVNTIAWAVRKDAAQSLSAVLDDLPWKWVPYTPSGLALANGVRDALKKRPDAQVFVLGNHGLVIGADDQGGLEMILAEVERRLALPVRSSVKPDFEGLGELCMGTGWKVPQDDELHALGNDLITREILARGLLVPSQAALADLFRPAHICRETLSTRIAETTPFLILENQGVLIRPNAQWGDIALLSGLVKVARRIEAKSPVRYLSEREVRDLNAPLYQNYRERARSGSCTQPRA
jgi:rhamnose utilization protein RhaD (predicted bifunctional aldolase and dehydrogenase)